MRNRIKILKSIRTKLFLSLCIIVIAIIISLIVLNNFVLRKFYEYNKEKQLKNVYETINNYYNSNTIQKNLADELDRIAINNNFDILIRSNENVSVYSSNKDYYSTIGEMVISILREEKNQSNILQKTEKYTISKFSDSKTNINYIMLIANLDNSYNLYIRMPVTSIEESVKISNEFLYIIAIFVIIIGGTVLSIVSQRFSEPIVELNQIAKKMSNLDFSQKYKPSDENDEIDMLGNSINTLSNKLEGTIKQLRSTNTELERDIEEKSKIDEMRKSFISDVSHELKTPIALIQGYSEGLIEDVNTDEESRKFYAEVILDEATKMDRLVKRLLELMKLEYGKMDFNNKEFNIVELENEIITKSEVIIEKENIKLENDTEGEIWVYSDDFYIDQVLTNYITNAIRYATEINGEKIVRIENEILQEQNKVRIKVFNTFEQFTEEDMARIWNRFYKGDESRNRDKGGSGIGLALVKAIMNNYGNKYGVRNVAGGVEFYFDVDLK
jgi:two-component system sensor histidine kinase VanS